MPGRSSSAATVLATAVAAEAAEEELRPAEGELRSQVAGRALPLPRPPELPAAPPPLEEESPCFGLGPSPTAASAEERAAADGHGPSPTAVGAEERAAADGHEPAAEEGEEEEEEEEEASSDGDRGAHGRGCASRDLEEVAAAARDELDAMLRRQRLAMLSASWLDRPSRYGPGATLPELQPGKHVPVLGLINPRSGAGAGADILELCRVTPGYQSRFFNIVDVAKGQSRGGLMDVFRLELQQVRQEAEAMGARPRLVCGGGDGTASFALFVLFAALRADGSRAEEGLADAGNGFIWSDTEMLRGFPALAQLPLGSANDLGCILGWGKRYPGDPKGLRCQAAEPGQELHRWFEAVVSTTSRCSNFDVWGILPRPGSQFCGFKICELDGPRGSSPMLQVKGRKQLVMKEADVPMPFFVLNYFSVGFMSYTVGRFQINRHASPEENTMEYVRQGHNILRETTPPQLQAGAEGITIKCEGGVYHRRAPHARCGGPSVSDLGFFNINLQAQVMHGADRVKYPWQRFSSKRQPVKFNDGLLDMYRMRLCSLLRCPFIHWHQTDKRRDLEVAYSGERGQGVFFQWDGEARFAFSPSQGSFSIYIRRVLNIPVVIGPGFSQRLNGPLERQPVAFFFVGDNMRDREQVRHRIFRLLSGDLQRELAATRQELATANLLREEGQSGQ